MSTSSVNTSTKIEVESLVNIGNGDLEFEGSPEKRSANLSEVNRGRELGGDLRRALIAKNL